MIRRTMALATGFVHNFGYRVRMLTISKDVVNSVNLQSKEIREIM